MNNYPPLQSSDYQDGNTNIALSNYENSSISERSDNTKDINASGEFLDKEMSVMMAGVAIIFMMIHHLFGFQNWYTDESTWVYYGGYIEHVIIERLSDIGSICVQIFALMSGYALVKNPRAYCTRSKRIRRLVNFLITYWLICLLFLIYGYFAGENLPSVRNIIYNMFGCATGPTKGWINVPFAWYVMYYIEFIILSPLLIWGFSKHSKYRDAIFLFFMMLLVYVTRKITLPGILNYIIVYLYPLISTLLGVVLAKYRVFDRIHQSKFSKIPVVVLVILIAIVINLRIEVSHLNRIGGSNWGYAMQCLSALTSALLILLFVEIFHKIKNKVFRKSLILLGSLSLYLWFLHGIFFTGTSKLQPFIYSSHITVVILLLCIATLLPVALILKWVQSKLKI